MCWEGGFSHLLTAKFWQRRGGGAAAGTVGKFLAVNWTVKGSYCRLSLRRRFTQKGDIRLQRICMFVRNISCLNVMMVYYGTLESTNSSP